MENSRWRIKGNVRPRRRGGLPIPLPSGGKAVRLRAVTPTKIFGLTGGVGMGKSTVAQLLAQRGVPVVDTDVLARKVVEPGQPALAAIQEMFGAAVLAPDGSLRRDELARRVFASEFSR